MPGGGGAAGGPMSVAAADMDGSACVGPGCLPETGPEPVPTGPSGQFLGGVPSPTEGSFCMCFDFAYFMPRHSLVQMSFLSLFVFFCWVEKCLMYKTCSLIPTSFWKRRTM